jgi:uncharacterized RDD family membrane protein YckC
MESTETVFQEEAKAAPERIGFGRRLGAYLLDIVVAGIGGGVIGMFAGAGLTALFFASAEMDEAMEGAEEAGGAIVAVMGGMLGTLAGMMLIFLAIMVLEALTGQTIGKMILGIKNGDEDGGQASTGKLATRALVKYISYVMTLLAGITGVAMIGTVGSLLGFAVFIGFFFILGEKKQGFHDMIAKTAVFNKGDLG